MSLTIEQVTALAPDPGSANNGKKLAKPAPWSSLGHNDGAIWGACKGSGKDPYKVSVDRADFTSKCSCPSRKFPCKHALGLLYLFAQQPAAVPQTADPPDWVATWLEGRQKRAEKKLEKVENKKPVDEAAQAKRAEKRHQTILAGLDNFDLWLADIVRNGLASVENEAYDFWTQQALRMGDAQASGIAGRLRKIESAVGATIDWPAKVLGELGRLALLSHAYRRLDDLDEKLREDVRGAIGITKKSDEVMVGDDVVADTWRVIGQWVDDEDDRMFTQRSWLVGENSSRLAMYLQFRMKNVQQSRFTELIAPGSIIAGELAFYPGAWPLRAVFKTRTTTTALSGDIPGANTVGAFLQTFADGVAKQPWLDRIGGTIKAVTPIVNDDGRWEIADRDRATLPLVGREHWRLLALSGGNPVDVCGEWDGLFLRPLGAIVDGKYFALANLV